MSKALIKKTGKVGDITQSVKVMKLNFKFGTNSENSSDKKDEEWTYDSDVELKPNDGYYIINGHKFYEDEIVIGDDNIRDWKIKNIIE